MAFKMVDANNNIYMTEESDAFFEGYCQAKNITTKDLANDAGHFDIVCQLYEEYLKNKKQK